MSLHRRVSALEAATTRNRTYRSPEQERDREARFNELWRQLYEEYGIERPEPSEDPLEDYFALVEEWRRQCV